MMQVGGQQAKKRSSSLFQPRRNCSFDRRIFSIVKNPFLHQSRKYIMQVADGRMRNFWVLVGLEKGMKKS